MAKKITSNSTLAEVLSHPEAFEILSKYKLPCLWCPMAKFEAEKLKIGEICKMYKIDSEALIKELNEKIKKK